MEITVHREAQHAKDTTTDSPHILDAAVHYTSAIDRRSQIWERTRIHSDSIKQITQNWKNAVPISAPYKTYKQTFIDLLLQLELMWNGHFDTSR